MQGPGVCIRKISGSVEVTSRSAPTFLQSQIFYVRTSEGHALPYRGFQLPPCPGALSVSALRAGALALAPTCTVMRAETAVAFRMCRSHIDGRRKAVAGLLLALVCSAEAPFGRVRWRWHPPSPGCGPGGEPGSPGAQSVPQHRPGAAPGVPLARFSAFLLNQVGKPNAAENEPLGKPAR